MSGVFYPGLACVFTLRFDEVLLNGSIPAPGSAQSLAKRGSLIAGPPSKKADLLEGARDRLTKRLGVVPKTASLELPGYRQAPKFSLSFLWRDLPIDPRAVRALGVEIYVGAVDPGQFSRTMLFRSEFGRLAASLLEKPDNLMLVGVADSVTTDFGDKGSELVVEGRGLQGIFLDARIHEDSLKDLQVRQPIDDLVRELLSRAGLSAKVPVEADPPSEWPGGQIPGVATDEVVTRINKGAKGTDAKMPASGDSSSMHFWDAVVQFCYLVGAVPYFEGHTLRLRPATSLYERKKRAAAGTTPFRPNRPRSVRTSKGQEESFSIRRMVYGANLSRFRLERKTAGASKLPTVRVVCNDPDAAEGGQGQVLEAQWPEDTATNSQKASDVAPSGSESKQEKMTVPVYGIKSKVRLRQIARALYEEAARGELSGTASSKDLASLAGDNADADLLRLRPGDPVEFLVDASGLRTFPPVIADPNVLASKSPQEAASELAEQLGDRDLADILVGTARGQFQGLQDFFHVQTVKYSWDAGSGLAVDFDFQNYMEARFDASAVKQKSSSIDDVVAAISDALDTVDEKLKAKEPKKKPVGADEPPMPPWLRGRNGR